MKENIDASVYWFTGLSGSGKTTLARKLYIALLDSGKKVEFLDGDELRKHFPQTGFTKEAREEHIKRVGYLASRLQHHGIHVIASFISPFEASRAFNRSLCSNFIEIYVSTPLSVCEERDVKGLYEKARNGEIENFTGISAPYEVPSSPDITIDTSSITIDEALHSILKHIGI